MVDTGAVISIIKKSSLPKSSLPWTVNLKFREMCNGIGSAVGAVKMKLGNTQIIFYVLNDDMATFCSDGILGAEYMDENKATICYD